MNFIEITRFLTIAILIFYYGIIPLLGFEIWMRDKGWIEMAFGQAIFNIILGIIIIIFMETLKNKFDKAN
jgi:cbb3-type cytochrome oxidase subunit 3